METPAWIWRLREDFLCAAVSIKTTGVISSSALGSNSWSLSESLKSSFSKNFNSCFPGATIDSIVDVSNGSISCSSHLLNVTEDIGIGNICDRSVLLPLNKSGCWVVNVMCVEDSENKSCSSSEISFFSSALGSNSSSNIGKTLST